jgi:hypothetical protein
LHGAARRGYLSPMRLRFEGRRGAAAAGVMLLLCIARDARAGVTLSVSSATVQNAGDSGQICVSLSTGGEKVAGTQNDLTWDGNCASLPGDSSCYAAGTHGKSLSGKLITARDFTYRALILSLNDVDPIDDGVLYCCSFESEAEPGSCCNISIVGAQAADPSGKAIGANGRPGKICTAGDSSGARPGGVNVNPGSFTGNDAGVGQGAAAPAANSAPAASGASAPPVSQVLQGGGARPGGADGNAVPTLSAPNQQTAPTPASAAATDQSAPAAAVAPVIAPTAAKPLAPPTAAATAAVAAPAMGATPAAAEMATVAATAPAAAADTATPAHAASSPTRRAVAAPTVAESKSSGGLFGCQVGPADGAACSLVPGGLVLLAAACAWCRRTR